MVFCPRWRTRRRSNVSQRCETDGQGVFWLGGLFRREGLLDGSRRSLTSTLRTWDTVDAQFGFGPCIGDKRAILGVGSLFPKGEVRKGSGVLARGELFRRL